MISDNQSFPDQPMRMIDWVGFVRRVSNGVREDAIFILRQDAVAKETK